MWDHHLTLVLYTMFGWPAGIVLGNLMASVLWVPIQWAGIQVKLREHHNAVHARLDAQDGVLAEIRKLAGQRGDLHPGDDSP